MALLQGYLEDPSFLEYLEKEECKLEYASRNDITKCAQDLFMRLFGQDQVPGGNERQDVKVADADSNMGSPPLAKCS